MKLFTLIHINKNEHSIHNNGFFIRNIEQQIDLYYSCAKKLHESLKPVGIDLVIITNDALFLEKLNKDQYKIDIVQLDFLLKVPTGVNFYSAHFKIEVYGYLAKLDDSYVGLIDNDIICINDLPTCFKNIIDQKIPLYYDITDQVTPAFGQDRIISDKEKVSKNKSIGLWAGGEFICGPPDFFAQLCSEISEIEENYFLVTNSLHHQSDEVLTSVAIENLRIKKGLSILDAGVLAIVARFWSPKPLHSQKPIKAYYHHFLLHIPSDKNFITKLKSTEMKSDAFFNKYKRHLIKSRILEKTFKNLKPYLKKFLKK